MHVVIVDSSQTITDFIAKQVLKNGNTVSVFSSGVEASEYLNSKEPVDILLTGLELPGYSGLELCWDADVRSQSGRPNYVIAMSSSSDVETLIESLDSGADDFLKKPFVEGELFARLRAAERTLNAQKELLRMASIDLLTGVSNRWNFFSRIDEALFSMKSGSPCSMIMFDIDHFKTVNDDFGHDVGDKVLKKIGEELNADDLILGRLGGEEFGLFLPDADIDQAFAKAEEMRRTINRIKFQQDDVEISVAASFGVAQRNKKESVDALLKKADQALYAAKNLGRDQTVIWGSVEHQSAIDAVSSVQGYDHIANRAMNVTSKNSASAVF